MNAPVIAPALRAAARGLLVAVLLTAASLYAAATAGAATPKPVCSGDPSVVRNLIFSSDPTYNGLYAVPRGKPTNLVVFAHGHGHTPNAWRDILVRTARNDNAIAVAMEYPKSELLGYDSQHGWRVQEGADNSIRAGQLFERRCKGLDTIVDYGVSMGGNTSGLMAAAGAKRHNGKPLFDLWFDIEGVTNLIEEYLGVRTLAATGNADAALAQSEIEQENGGTFEQVPQEYQKRTVVARAEDIQASGIRGVVIVHAVDDGQVPYDQSRQMATRLTLQGISTSFYTVGSAGPTPTGTTLDGLLIGQPHPQPFVGHGFEGDQTHLVIKTGLDHLDAILQGREPFPMLFHEHFVDGTLGTSFGI